MKRHLYITACIMLCLHSCDYSGKTGAPNDLPKGEWTREETKQKTDSLIKQIDSIFTHTNADSIKTILKETNNKIKQTVETTVNTAKELKQDCDTLHAKYKKVKKQYNDVRQQLKETDSIATSKIKNIEDKINKTHKFIDKTEIKSDTTRP